MATASPLDLPDRCDPRTVELIEAAISHYEARANDMLRRRYRSDKATGQAMLRDMAELRDRLGLIGGAR